MKRLLLTLLTAALIFCVPYALFTVAYSEPSTEVINSDLSEVQHRLDELNADAARFDGSLILSLFEMRRQMLEATKDMLLQKRRSLLRRISLEYAIQGRPYVPNDARLKAIESDIQDALKAVTASELEAERYSGGLVQSLSLVNVATAKLMLAQLQMTFYAEKYGLLPTIQPSSVPSSTATNIVPDGDAL